MRNATRLVDGFKQGLQFLKGSAGDANHKSLARKSLGDRPTCCITGPYHQANFCFCHCLTLGALLSDSNHNETSKHGVPLIQLIRITHLQ
jgi:hypothetical protein